MKISDIPNEMKFIFGPNLREVPVSKIQMLTGMIYIMDKLKSNDFTEAEKAQRTNDFPKEMDFNPVSQDYISDAARKRSKLY